MAVILQMTYMKKLGLPNYSSHSCAAFFRGRCGMLIAKVAVGFHCQRSAVLVSEPAGDGGNIYTGFDAGGSEQMAEVVVNDSRKSENQVVHCDAAITPQSEQRERRKLLRVSDAVFAAVLSFPYAVPCFITVRFWAGGTGEKSTRRAARRLCSSRCLL